MILSGKERKYRRRLRKQFQREYDRLKHDSDLLFALLKESWRLDASRKPERKAVTPMSSDPILK